MATILLVGGDTALLEGLAQSLAAAGHRTHIATAATEAVESARLDPPLVGVLERDLVLRDASALHLQLLRGGALMLYRATGRDAPALSPVLQRAVMADLELPLERHRLLALVQRVVERVRVTGRDRRDTPPETRLV
jgi:DNA-binding NtrC family response regulator